MTCLDRLAECHNLFYNTDASSISPGVLDKTFLGALFFSERTGG